MNIPFKKALLPSLIGSIVLLSACGGGSNDTSTTANRTVTTGVITGFGSVYVNGCKYETESASIDSDDVSATGTNGQSNLDVGMVVTVSGSSTTDASGNCTGTADKIIYDNDVEGPVAAGSLTVTATDPVSGAATEISVEILGQTVVMNLDTVFKSQSGATYDLASVNEGDNLEVSGMMDNTGSLIATRVELQDQKDYSSSDMYELKGMVASLDTSAMTFSINGMAVSYDSNTQLEGMTDLTDGLYVEVKGMLNSAGDTLMAAKIQAEDDGMDEGYDYHSEIEGVISNWDPVTQTFSLMDITVDASSVKKYKPSGLQLGDGLRVEVEGDLTVASDGSKTLTAYEISQKGLKIKIQATIQSIDSDTDPSADLVILSVFGQEIPVRVNQQTQIKVEYGTGTTYAVGDFVEVEAFDDGSGVINAIELKVASTDSVELKGPVDGYDADNMTVTLFGIPFDISSASMVMDHQPAATPADFWSSVDSQGSVKLIDEQPADGTIDKIKIDN